MNYPVPPPGTRCLFILGNQSRESGRWSDKPRLVTIKGTPKLVSAQVRGGHTHWEVVSVLPDDEAEARPVACSRYHGPIGEPATPS